MDLRGVLQMYNLTKLSTYSISHLMTCEKFVWINDELVFNSGERRASRVAQYY
jgi:hypothetical protein